MAAVTAARESTTRRAACSATRSVSPTAPAERSPARGRASRSSAATTRRSSPATVTAIARLLSDNVGNQGSSPASNTAKIDTSAPSTPSLAFGGLSANAYYDGAGTLYLRPSAGGTFTVTARSTDGQSDITSYAFGTLNSNGGSNFGGSQTGDHFDYTFGAATTAPSTARTVSSTNGAGHELGERDVHDRSRHDVAVRDRSRRHRRLLHEQLRSGHEERRQRRGLWRGQATSIVERDVANLTNGSCGASPAAGRR